MLIYTINFGEKSSKEGVCKPYIVFHVQIILHKHPSFPNLKHIRSCIIYSNIKMFSYLLEPSRKWLDQFSSNLEMNKFFNMKPNIG